MTQITINIEDSSMVPHLKKILSAISGVTISKTTRASKKTGVKEAMDDIAAGRVCHAESVSEMFKNILGE